jgi:YfiH family protein
MQTFYRFDHFAKQDRLMHVVTKKDITKDFAFSMALHTGESREKIISNRKHLIDLLGVGKDFVFVAAKQIHSDNIFVVENAQMQGWDDLDSAIGECDALVSNLEGVALTILTADCVPILLYDPIKRVVAAIHAGWKGTQKEIVVKTINVMRERFACNPYDILAGVAPAIGGCCYEVGGDVASHFFGYDNAIEQQGEKYMLDLPEINRIQMITSGIKKSHIQMSNICTACEADSYFSYRKEQRCSGRFMSVIGMK